MIYKDRMTARMDGDFVVFLIGMRINKPLAVHKYLPVLNAMPKMLTELYTKPELGLIHHEMWFSRTIILVQYWRSMEQLIDYAKNKDSAHLPAWQAFNKAVVLAYGMKHTKQVKAPMRMSTPICRRLDWVKRELWLKLKVG
jgi:hypothetical protein